MSVAVLSAATASPALPQTFVGCDRSRAAAANTGSAFSLLKPQALPARVHVTLRASLPSNAAHGVAAITPTPYGSGTISSTPATAFALASSILSGPAPSTGERRIAP